MEVTYSDVITELVKPAGNAAKQKLQEWRNRQELSKVVPFVEQFVHRTLYRLSHSQVTEAISRTEHALGNVRAKEQLKEIEDISVPFALEHLFHECLEAKEQVPTWGEFRLWLEQERRDRWLTPAAKTLRNRGLDPHSQAVARAVRWRLGKFFYSALREVELLVWLREQGINIRYHVLADVLFAVDFWVGQVLVSLYFPNRAYREGAVGRKRSPRTYFVYGDSPFHCIEFNVRRAGFGRVWLVHPEDRILIRERISGMLK